MVVKLPEDDEKNPTGRTIIGNSSDFKRFKNVLSNYMSKNHFTREVGIQTCESIECNDLWERQFNRWWGWHWLRKRKDHLNRFRINLCSKENVTGAKRAFKLNSTMTVPKFVRDQFNTPESDYTLGKIRSPHEPVRNTVRTSKFKHRAYEPWLIERGSTSDSIATSITIRPKKHHRSIQENMVGLSRRLRAYRYDRNEHLNLTKRAFKVGAKAPNEFQFENVDNEDGENYLKDDSGHVPCEKESRNASREESGTNPKEHENDLQRDCIVNDLQQRCENKFTNSFRGKYKNFQEKFGNNLHDAYRCDLRDFNKDGNKLPNQFWNDFSNGVQHDLTISLSRNIVRDVTINKSHRLDKFYSEADVIKNLSERLHNLEALTYKQNKPSGLKLKINRIRKFHKYINKNIRCKLNKNNYMKSIMHEPETNLRIDPKRIDSNMYLKAINVSDVNYIPAWKFPWFHRYFQVKKDHEILMKSLNENRFQIEGIENVSQTKTPVRDFFGGTDENIDRSADETGYDRKHKSFDGGKRDKLTKNSCNYEKESSKNENEAEDDAGKEFDEFLDKKKKGNIDEHKFQVNVQKVEKSSRNYAEKELSNEMKRQLSNEIKRKMSNKINDVSGKIRRKLLNRIGKEMPTKNLQTSKNKAATMRNNFELAKHKTEAGGSGGEIQTLNKITIELTNEIERQLLNEIGKELSNEIKRELSQNVEDESEGWSLNNKEFNKISENDIHHVDSDVYATADDVDDASNYDFNLFLSPLELKTMKSDLNLSSRTEEFTLLSPQTESFSPRSFEIEIPNSHLSSDETHTNRFPEHLNIGKTLLDLDSKFNRLFSNINQDQILSHRQDANVTYRSNVIDREVYSRNRLYDINYITNNIQSFSSQISDLQFLYLNR